MTGCSTVAVNRPTHVLNRSLFFYVYPANTHILQVEPRGFEPLTSAVQSQSKICCFLLSSARIRFSTLRSALAGPCECRQSSSPTASSAATLLLVATFLAGLVPPVGRG